MPDSIDDIDPDQLLKHCHQGLAMNNPSLLAVSFATLDKYLSLGGELPSRWSSWMEHGVQVERGARTYTPVETKSALAQALEFVDGPEVTVLDAERNVTVVDKRGRRG